LEVDFAMTESGPLPVHEGDLVAGKYRVEGVIGVGGMGVVMAARHEQLDQRVAIKFVRSPALSNEEGVQRFLREARATVRLKSEHAARVLDVGTLESGLPFMVMELLEGSDLSQVLTERGPLSVEEAADWIVQACEALAEAHAAGIVHRDLKPQNLFLAQTVGGAAKVKVLDFGVSKSIESMTSGPGALTRTSAMLGSPLYMAPEQMRSSRDVDARVDVWALGVVLFELLTQRWPFEAETLPALCLKVVGDAPRSLAELRPDLPETMIDVVGRCLEKDAAKRFANAAEVASALESLVPAGSRVLVERARLAIHRVPLTTPPGGSGAPLRDRSAKWTPPPKRSTPTPSAWGSARGTSPAPRARMRAAWAGAGVLALAALGGGALLLRDRPTASPFAGSSPAAGVVSVASVASGALAGSSVTTVAPSPATTLLPPPGDVAPRTAPNESAEAVATTASDSSKPPSRFVPTAVPARAGAAPAAPAVPAVVLPPVAPPPQAPKPPRHDDDIPALR
jgi:eukaryotic-like serine/threonine-protein kinase